MLGKKKPSAPGAEWWEQTEEAPRAGLPSAQKQRKNARWFRVYVWAAVVMFPLALVANILILGSQSATTATTATAAPDKFAETRSVALVAVREWLSSDPTPLPGGEVVGWDSATVKNWKPPVADGIDAGANEQGPYRIETHHVTLSTAEGAMFTASVSVTYDEAHGAVASEAPALSPVLPADESWVPGEYPSLDPTSPSEDVDTAIAAWVVAYSSGDPALLRQTVGDADAAHSYLPLTGARLREPSTGEAWVTKLAAPADDMSDALPGTLIARVTANIDWAVAPIESAGDAPVVTFDLLIEGANTAAPKVVAWGGVGEGLNLSRHSNAITTRVVEGDTSGTDEFEETVPAEPEPSDEPTTKPDRKAERTAARKAERDAEQSSTDTKESTE